MTDIARHEMVCKELTDLYMKKNADYGDSFHTSFEKYGLVMAAIRLGDKFNRFESLIGKEAQVKDENIRDTLIDLANYAIMTVMELDIKQKHSDAVSASTTISAGPSAFSLMSRGF